MTVGPEFRLFYLSAAHRVLWPSSLHPWGFVRLLEYQEQKGSAQAKSCHAKSGDKQVRNLCIRMGKDSYDL